MHVADITEIHHGTEPVESINEINDVNIEINESATNKAAPKEAFTPIPPNSSFMFHKNFLPQT